MHERQVEGKDFEYVTKRQLSQILAAFAESNGKDMQKIRDLVILMDVNIRELVKKIEDITNAV